MNDDLGIPPRFARGRSPPSSPQLQSVVCMVVKGASVGRSLTPCIPSLSSFAGFLGSALMQAGLKSNGLKPKKTEGFTREGCERRRRRCEMERQRNEARERSEPRKSPTAWVESWGGEAGTPKLIS